MEMSVDRLVNIIKHQKIVMNKLNRKVSHPILVGKHDIILKWRDYEDPVEFRKRIEDIGKDIVAYSFFSLSCSDSPAAIYFGIREA